MTRHRRGLLVTFAVTALIIATGAGCSVASEEETASASGADLSGQRYDEAYGNRIANKALRVNGHGSGDRCLAEVQNSLEYAGVKPMPRLDGAVDLDNWMMRQGDRGLAPYGFQKQSRAFGDIPRGSIIAWRPGQCGYHPIYGHIEIVVGGGRACSDFCGTIKTYCGAPNIYVPVGFGPTRCGTGTLNGAIDDHYQDLGGCSSFLGAPTTDELTSPDKVGKYNVFEHGSIYWSPSTGAHEVHGSIRDEWKTLGWEVGLLGYPTTDEGPSADGHGRYNHFQHGSIYWKEATGAHEVHGAIHDKWQALGWEMSLLGYPTADEAVSADGKGHHSEFENGSIYYTEATGAHETHGEIRKAWLTLGGETSKLGYPTSDEYAVAGGRKSDFQNGSITWDLAGQKATVEMKDAAKDPAKDPADPANP
jgi:hypothetical protein